MPTLDRIRVHPIKALDPVDLPSVGIENGGLQYDRKYAMFDADGEYVNGKNHEEVHRLRLEFDPETDEVTFREQGTTARHTFHIDAEREAVDAWLSEFFGMDVSLLEASDTRFTDSADDSAPTELPAAGPSVVSERTYREVASWFPELDAGDVRNRFRTNLEISDVPPFWEDRLFSDDEHVMEFRVGDVLCRGVLPLPRCVVPSRDPFTGERDGSFVETFTENREAKFPDWASAEHLGDHLTNQANHYFYLTVVTRIPDSEHGARIEVGDDVEVLDERAIAEIR